MDDITNEERKKWIESEEKYKRLKDRVKEFDLDNAKSEISNIVYKYTSLFEMLENMEKVIGNGHHMRQEVAKFASDLMEKRWKK